MSRPLNVLGILALTAGLGCGSSKPPTEEPVTAGDTQTAGSGHLAVVAMRLTVEGESDMLIGADGRIEYDDRHLGTVYSDGRFEDSEGRVVATLGADGRVDIPGEDEDLHIGADGSLTSRGEPLLTVTLEGELSGPFLEREGSGNRVRIEGPREGHRLAMFVLMVASTPVDKSPEEFDGVEAVPAD